MSFLKYSDLKDIRVIPVTEDMVPVITDKIVVCPINDDMKSITGVGILVRREVFNKLIAVSIELGKIDTNMKLQLVYGYRSLSVQIRYFEELKTKFKGRLSGLELTEQVHKFIAVPEVSGHPTGGAVDIHIIDEFNCPLDFGSRIWQFKPISETYNPGVSRVGFKNRMLLRKLMVQQGFAPFDGEWWHFSYGDREWARYYSKSFAIYDQI